MVIKTSRDSAVMAEKTSENDAWRVKLVKRRVFSSDLRIAMQDDHRRRRSQAHSCFCYTGSSLVVCLQGDRWGRWGLDGRPFLSTISAKSSRLVTDIR